MKRCALLDTSVVIDLENIDLGEWASTQPIISAVTVGELSYGADTNDPVQRLARSQRLRSILTGYEVLPFGRAEAELYGVLAALVRRVGRDPRPRRMDLQIAATAGAASLPLITRNGRDFTGIEATVDIVSV